jgi:ligand-binding sensor domain-containing protein
VARAFKNAPTWWREGVVFLACSVLCHAQRYSFKHYWQDSGLTNLAVNTINQDKDGFLWVASDNGLFRYNGLRFERFGREDGLPQDDVTGLAVSPGGAVWAGTPVGIAYLSGGRFRPIQFGPGQHGWSFRHLVAGQGNTAYASTSYGLVKLSLDSAGVSVKKIYSGETSAVAVEAGGTVWFGCEFDLCRLQGGETTRMNARLRLPRDRLESAVSDERGALWVRSESHLYKLPPNASAFVERDTGLPLAPGQVSELRADPIYGVTVPTNDGFAIPRGDGWKVIGERQGLASDAVATAFRDREGSLWIGLRGSGVDRWTGERQWENWTKAEGLLEDMLWGLAKDPKGRIWVGTTSGISLVDPSTGRIQTWGNRRRIKENEAFAVQADPTGRIWLGGAHGGLTRFDPKTAHRQRFGEKDGIVFEKVRRVLLGPDNTLWVLGASGVYRSTSVLHDPIRFERQSIPAEDPRQIYSNGAFDDDGCIWITSDNGLYRYGGGRWYHYDEKDGLKSASVSPIAISNGSLWVAYRSPLGLTRISGVSGRLRRFAGRSSQCPPYCFLFASVTSRPV